MRERRWRMHWVLADSGLAVNKNTIKINMCATVNACIYHMYVPL